MTNDIKAIDDFIKILEDMKSLKIRHRDITPYVITTDPFSKALEPVIDTKLRENITKDLLYLRYSIEKLNIVLRDLEKIK